MYVSACWQCVTLLLSSPVAAAAVQEMNLRKACPTAFFFLAPEKVDAPHGWHLYHRGAIVMLEFVVDNRCVLKLPFFRGSGGIWCIVRGKGSATEPATPPPSAAADTY